MDADRIFFITTITAQRRAIFRHEPTVNLMIETLLHYRQEHKYLLHEFVIMPDHLHLLITPSDDLSLERAVQFIKGGFSFRLKSRFIVWEESFTNHRIRDLEDYRGHQEYIWLNPVRAGIVAQPDAYPYSSAARRLDLDPVPQGLMPRDVFALTRA